MTSENGKASSRQKRRAGDCRANRKYEFSTAVPTLAVHDEIVAEHAEEEADKVKAWLERARVNGMDEVLNGQGSKVPTWWSR